MPLAAVTPPAAPADVADVIARLEARLVALQAQQEQAIAQANAAAGAIALCRELLAAWRAPAAGGA
jgi:hypothetical protein